MTDSSSLSSSIGSQSLTNFERNFITITVMIVAIIEILDMTIVNVALPAMMGDLGANADQITWILTSYIVSSAIVMPLTGFFVTYFGRKKLLLTSITGFLLFSMLCGLSTSLTEIILFRIGQGMFGALLVPLSQYILNDAYPKKDRGKAMAIWGIGLMVAPILGPTVGGYITDAMSWRWIFYINVPVCIGAFFLATRFIKETVSEKKYIDWVGLLLLALGIGALQIFLDRGNTDNWFHSNSILILCFVWVCSFIIFIVRGINKPDNIINLKLFKSRNFTITVIMLSVSGIAIFGIIAVIPIMLERLMGYTPKMAGIFMAPRALASAVGMFSASFLIKKIDPRWLIGLGLVLFAYSAFLMCSFNLQASFEAMMWPNMLMGLGGGLFFVPLSTVSLNSLPDKYIAEGTGFFNFGRNLGASIGISILSTLLSRETQINWHRLAGHITRTSYPFLHWLQANGLSFSPIAITRVADEVLRQSNMIAFLDSFWFVVVSAIAVLPLILLMKKVNLHN